MRPRFGIAALMALVSAVAVGVAALRAANDAWASAVFTLALGILGVAVLGTAFRRGRSQAFFAGFATFGTAYLALWASADIRPHLATTKLLDYAARRVVPTQAEFLYDLLVTGDVVVRGSTSPGQTQGNGTALADLDGDGHLDQLVVSNTPSGSRLVLTPRDSASFFRVGHSLFALFAAMLGGLIGRHFHATRHADVEGRP